MTQLVDEKACFAAALIDRQPRNSATLSALLVAGVAILAPLASAQQRSQDPASLSFDPNPWGQDKMTYHAHSLPVSDRCDSYGDAAVCAERDDSREQDSIETPGTDPVQDTKNKASKRKSRSAKPDFNRDIYYKNKLEFAFDVGWLPINVPFPFDVFEGDPYELYPLRYTLVPIQASLRWHLDDVGGPLILRGNWDATFTLSATAIPRGAETHYFSYDMGVRRNFVPRNWRVAPYWDVRAGMGFIDAKGPLGVYYAQGQNFTFTLNMGAGVRYDVNPRYAFSAGLNWMHISNGNLSSPGYSNYGINVYGPMFGIDIQLRRPQKPFQR
jgi:hypothetical protein